MRRIRFFQCSLLYIGIAILGIIVFLPGYIRIQELRYRKRELEEKITRIKKENERLRWMEERLTDDPVYIERRAREKMALGKEGEVIYRIEGESRNL